MQLRALSSQLLCVVSDITPVQLTGRFVFLVWDHHRTAERDILQQHGHSNCYLKIMSCWSRGLSQQTHNVLYTFNKHSETVSSLNAARAGRFSYLAAQPNDNRYFTNAKESRTYMSFKVISTLNIEYLHKKKCSEAYKKFTLSP
jgi:hypothetical protein